MTTSTDRVAFDPDVLKRLVALLMDNPTITDLGDEERRAYRACALTVEALANGMPEGNVVAGSPNLPELIERLRETDEWIPALNPLPDVDPGPTITLDRSNLRRLVAYMRALPSADMMPPPFRAGYAVALASIESLLPGMPDLYGDTGCPNVPDLLSRLGKCETLAEVREVIWPLAFDQWVGLSPAENEGGGAR